jgi:fructose-bisphosphate aldolase class 1
MNVQRLTDTAKELMGDDKGLLAMDESNRSFPLDNPRQSQSDASRK